MRAENQNYPGLNFIPGWFSWSHTAFFGRKVGATPNGRKAGEAISHGVNPHPGFRRDGAVTAMANSIAAIQPGYGNTAPVQPELDPAVAQTPEALDKLVSMIRTILLTGNTLLNINLIDGARPARNAGNAAAAHHPPHPRGIHAAGGRHLSPFR